MAVMAAISAILVYAQDQGIFPSTPALDTGGNRDGEANQFGPALPIDDLFGDPDRRTPTASSTAPIEPTLAPTEAASDVFGPLPSVTTAVATIAPGTKDSLCKCEGEENAAAISRIEKALSNSLSPAGLEFTDTPLEQVVQQLQDEFGLPIQIDTVAVEQIGVDAQKPVSTRLSNISVRSALRLVLKPLQLTYIIEHEVLMITSVEEADSRIRTCVYDVRDLVAYDPQMALKELTEVITSSIKADSWENNGSGRIRSYPPNLLVIAQTQDVHERVRNLLDTMRQMRQGARDDGKRPKPE
jgi:type II secretory pathway component GspD/PulD (secretin)